VSAPPPPPDDPRAQAELVLRRIAAATGPIVEIAEGALALASFDRPRVGLQRYRHHLELLAGDVAEAAAAGGNPEPPLDQRARLLARVMVERHGYEGDRLTYDDLQNANLMRVIDRRRGLPVALGILYLHAARAQGWAAVGLNFPGHFLIRLDDGGRRLILDPFAGGRVCAAAELRELLHLTQGPDAALTPDHYGPAADRAVLLRLQNNIKLRLIRDEQIERALQVVEGMLLFAPDQTGLWREAGLLHAHLGNLRAGIAALERFLEIDGSGHRHDVAVVLQALRARLN
jgi:regulator of sirC expression with transglutaminase-like and TPR domain